MFRIYVVTKSKTWALPPTYQDEREARSLVARLMANVDNVKRVGYLPADFVRYEVRAIAPDTAPQPRPYSFQCALYAS